MKSSLIIVSIVAMAPQLLCASVMTDPTLVTGPNAIDPNDSRNVNVATAGSTDQATLEAVDSFAVVQDWAAFTDGASAPNSVTNYISFTDPARPDVRMTFGPNANGGSGAAAQFAGTSYQTTPAGGGLYVRRAWLSQQVTITIDFGDWDGSTFTTTSTGPSAVGFTLSTLKDTTSVSAAFLDGASNVLSTQTASGLEDGFGNAYFGHASNGAPIAKVVVTVTDTAGDDIFHFDDLGFTVVPEPGSMGLISLGLLMVMRRHRCIR